MNGQRTGDRNQGPVSVERGAAECPAGTPDATALEGEPFITKGEVARRLRKPVRTVEDWMQRRVIPFYKLGQAVRFRWSEIQAHFAACYRVAAEEPAGGPGAEGTNGTKGTNGQGATANSQEPRGGISKFRFQISK